MRLVTVPLMVVMPAARSTSSAFWRGAAASSAHAPRHARAVMGAAGRRREGHPRHPFEPEAQADDRRSDCPAATPAKTKQPVDPRPGSVCTAGDRSKCTTIYWRSRGRQEERGRDDSPGTAASMPRDRRSRDGGVERKAQEPMRTERTTGRALSGYQALRALGVDETRHTPSAMTVAVIITN